MPTPRAGCAASSADGLIYVCGGTQPRLLNSFGGLAIGFWTLQGPKSLEEIEVHGLKDPARLLSEAVWARRS